MPYVLIALVVLFVVLVINAINILREYERGVVFTLGRYAGTKGPGMIIVWPFVQQMVRVDLRTIVLDVPKQDVISRDNVSVKVNAVVYFRIVDPDKAMKAAYRVAARPQTYFVDRAGVIRAIQIGGLTDADFERSYAKISR